MYINPDTDPTIRRYIDAATAERNAASVKKLEEANRAASLRRQSKAVAKRSRKAQAKAAKRRRQEKAERYATIMARIIIASTELQVEFDNKRFMQRLGYAV